jgi:hypothetical protein
MRLSAAGYMLDFRYRVTDPEKAALLGDRRVRAYLIHQDSGAKMVVPAPAKIGPLRQTARQLKSGRTYFMFFANPGRLVKPGDTVTVVIGKFRVENLVVQGLGEAPQTVQMKEII